MNKKAFTLIELLVVISIIAMLLAILMPALGIVKKKAQAAVCLSNLGQMSKAWYMYSAENSGKIVGGTTSVDPYQQVSPAWNASSWACNPQSENGAGVTATNSSIDEKINGIKRGLLYPYLENPKVYHCRGDQRYKTAPKAGGTGEGGYRSYSIAGAMFGVDLDKRSQSSWGIVPCTRQSQVKQPSSKYIFVEEMDGRGANMGSWVIRPVAKQWVDPIAIWHVDSSTLGFADGHADLRKWKDKSTITMAEKQTFYATPPANEGEDLEFMQDGYAFISLSGNSW
ncbi:MAG: type II secretion system protein [Anaerohalosphaera sp.]|nr:type II secretion system protein [Anaerohalosphaera sp.]